MDDHSPLRLTPFIGRESIRLEVDAEVNSISGIDPNGLPIVFSRTVRTTAVLKNGQVFSLTGLERKTRARQAERVFLLGHLPIVGGWLFTTHTDLVQASDFILVLKPRLLSHGSGGVEAPPAAEREVRGEEGPNGRPSSPKTGAP